MTGGDQPLGAADDMVGDAADQDVDRAGEAAYETEDEYAAGLAWDGLPGIPASSGALLRDEQGRILLLKPTYKSGWTLPGGVMESNGETPWEACRREVREETGLTVTAGRLIAVDTRPAKPSRAMGLRFLFDCGVVGPALRARIRLQAEEISEYRFVAPAEALELLRPAVSRRVQATLTASGCVYLEDGRPVLDEESALPILGIL